MSIGLSHQQRMKMLEDMPAETISPKQLASVLDGEPYQYNMAAQAGRFPLPHIWRGRNLRIFKQPLINLLSEGERATVLARMGLEEWQKAEE